MRRNYHVIVTVEQPTLVWSARCLEFSGFSLRGSVHDHLGNMITEELLRLVPDLDMDNDNIALEFIMEGEAQDEKGWKQ